MSVSLPASLRLFVDDRVRKDGYSTSSGNVRELIRADAVRRAERELADLMQGAGPPMRGVKPVRVLPEADRDADHAVAYRVESEALAAAQQLLLELEAAFAGLRRPPKAGSPGYGHVLPGLRFWILRRHPYLNFPVERPRFIDVLRVLHLARDLPAALREAG